METLKSISSRCACPSSHSEDLVEKAAVFEDSSGSGNQQCYPSEVFMFFSTTLSTRYFVFQ